MVSKGKKSNKSSSPPSDDDLNYNSNDEIHLCVLTHEIQDCEILNTDVFPAEGVSPQTVIQDAEYMHDPTMSAQTHCPAQCKGIIDNNPCLMIMDTGAAGSVVSMSYLSKVDPSWESKISG